MNLDSLPVMLAAVNAVPNVNAGGCALVASLIALHVPGARVYPIHAFDTDKLREEAGGGDDLHAIINATGIPPWSNRSFHNHFIVRLPDGREVDSEGISEKGVKSKATGAGFSGEEATAWFWDDRVGNWNPAFDRANNARKVVEIVRHHFRPE